MARPTEWRRVISSELAAGSSTTHDVRTTQVFAGETITRIRLEYRGNVLPTVPAAPVGCAVAVGVRYQQGLSTVPALSPWTDAGSEDWIWWEKASWQNDFAVQNSANAKITDGWSFPVGRGEIDSKAQRICPVDGIVWLQTRSDPAFAAQGNHSLSFGISVLVLLPVP